MHLSTFQAIAFSIIILSCYLMVTKNQAQSFKHMTFRDYPDIRAKPWGACGSHVPKFGYVCDPDSERLLSQNDAFILNQMLLQLATKTQCQCQRRSQCVTEIGPNNEKVQVGFVVAVAFVRDLTLLSTSENQVLQTAQKFTDGIREKWSLGDCGNSAVILVWDEQQMIFISNHDSLTKLYITDSEAAAMKKKVRQEIASRRYLAALMDILKSMEKEFNGKREEPIDVGTVALIFTSSVAIIVVGIIIGCVCAFRCFGNMWIGKKKDKKKSSINEHAIKRESIRRNEIIFDANATNYFDGADGEPSMV